MQRPGSGSKFYLNQLLTSSSTENYNAFIGFISTPEGFEDFLVTIKDNYTLSIIVLKNYVQSWIESKTLCMYYSDEFIGTIINLSITNTLNRNSQVLLSEYFHILSTNCLVSENILKSLIDNKLFILIDGVFRKYTLLSRSDALYTEIIRSVNMFFPVFQHYFFSPSVIQEVEAAYQLVIIEAKKTLENFDVSTIKPSLKSTINHEFEYLLNIFYSLTFQDIHPLFEDNCIYFFKLFFVLFDQNQEIINKIFNLFISKYPEICNFDLITLTLCRMNCLEGLSVNTLTQAVSYSSTYSNVVIAFLQKTLDTEIDDDWLTETQNIVRGNDVKRGFVHRLIRQINPNPFLFRKEAMFFVASILKVKDVNLILEAQKAISDISVKNHTPLSSYSNNTQLSIAFSAFRYLLNIKEYVDIDTSCLYTDLKFMGLKYLCSSMRSKEDVHKKILYNKLVESTISHSSALESPNVDANGHIQIPILYKRALEIFPMHYDEFSSELIFRIVKSYPAYITEDLYNTLRFHLQKVMQISSISLSFLFEILYECAIRLNKFDFSIVETIFKEESLETYNLCFFYLSILTSLGYVRKEIVFQILGQDAIWQYKDCHPGLACLLLAAYNKGFVNKEQMQGSVGVFEGFDKIFLYSKGGFELPLDTLSVEERYLVLGILDTNWLVENFMNKKYARAVVAKMIKSKVSKEACEFVLSKNSINIEHEIYPHFITKYFDF